MNEPIRQRAKELGFDECRFTSIEPPESAPKLQKWLAGKNFGEMSWLERNVEKRVDPRKVLTGAKSIISLAASYAREARIQKSEARSQSGDSHGVIARYARFDDYHDVLAARLKLLAQFINELKGADTRSLWYVDTGPILERDFAQRAGVGFVGKHTNLISRRFGNWIFLAEILTTLELAPDPRKKTVAANAPAASRPAPPTPLPRLLNWTPAVVSRI